MATLGATEPRTAIIAGDGDEGPVNSLFDLVLDFQSDLLQRADQKTDGPSCAPPSMGERTSGPRPSPTYRGVVCVLVYTAAFVGVTFVGFASFPQWVERPLQRALLRPAAWCGKRVDWAAHSWLDGLRRRLGTSPRVRALTRAVLDDAITPANEAAGYVGTVVSPQDDVVRWLERRLADAGFHRNATAYLEYRERNGRQFEHSSWALRSSVTADRQLHVRLYTSSDGTVDVYGHREPSVTAGADHYGTPNYPTGVRMVRETLEEAGVPLEEQLDTSWTSADGRVTDTNLSSQNARGTSDRSAAFGED